MARTPTLFGTMSVFSGLVAVTLKWVNFHRSRGTDGFLGVLNRLNPHFVALIKRCSLILFWPIPAMTQPIFRDSLIVSRLWASWIMTFLSLMVMASRRWPSNEVRKISASFPTTLALLVGSYLLTSARQAWNPSPSLLVSPALAQSSSRRSNSATVASSPGRASTDLIISCTRPRWNRPAQVWNTRDQSRHSVSSPLKFSGWYLAANAPNPNRQLPDYTCFACRLVLVDRRQPGLESFSPFFGQDNLQRLACAEENQCVIESRSQHSSAQHLPSHKTIDQLHKVSTPCLDDHQTKPEDQENARGLSDPCSQIVSTCLYLARIGRPDLLWTVRYLARSAYDEWKKELRQYWFSLDFKKAGGQKR